MSINANTVLTAGAVGLGLFALWFVVRGPGRATLVTTGEQQRAQGLATYWSGLGAFTAEMPQEPSPTVDLRAGIRGQRGYD